MICSEIRVMLCIRDKGVLSALAYLYCHTSHHILATRVVYMCVCYSLLYLRTLSVHKGDGDLGVVLRGSDPVIIESVIPKSAAERAGVLKGDCILKINRHNVV